MSAVRDVYDEIYALAEPYRHTRSNEIHVPQSYAETLRRSRAALR